MHLIFPANSCSNAFSVVVHSMSCEADDAVLWLAKNASPSCGGQQHAMVIRDVCPRCQSPTYKKNGHIHHGKQHHHCHGCGRQCVESFEQYLISDERRALIKRLLLERISLRGMCRAVGVTRKWLLGFRVQCVEALPDHLHVQPVTYTQNVMIQRLDVEADDMSCFVQKKANQPWIWIAMDARTRQVMAFHVGDRSRKRARCLWAMIPHIYRQHATFDTDHYVVYAGVIPAAQHRAISQLARQTHHIERFNNTRRQRVSRVVREALSFSKKLANHIGAIKLFICHDNRMRAAA